ncbi:sec-independent translocase [Streptomyces monashensis]|uniref:sec-independent translocase n=1 Tax=Streptomyces monashensis TaxID=1678012 RepID=UPI001FE32D79|nr:sec-independent translocase [Streptomyces monashensis]
MSPLDLLTLVLLAVLLFGPDKLPEVVQKVAGFVRTVRAFADSARDEVRAELGPEFKELELADLHPRTFVRKHVLDGLDRDGLGIDEIRSALDPRAELAEVAAAVNGEPAERPGSRAAAPQDAPAGTYDPDAT